MWFNQNLPSWQDLLSSPSTEFDIQNQLIYADNRLIYHTVTAYDFLKVYIADQVYQIEDCLIAENKRVTGVFGTSNRTEVVKEFNHIVFLLRNIRTKQQVVLAYGPYNNSIQKGQHFVLHYKKLATNKVKELVPVRHAKSITYYTGNKKIVLDPYIRREGIYDTIDDNIYPIDYSIFYKHKRKFEKIVMKYDVNVLNKIERIVRSIPQFELNCELKLLPPLKQNPDYMFDNNRNYVSSKITDVGQALGVLATMKSFRSKYSNTQPEVMFSNHFLMAAVNWSVTDIPICEERIGKNIEYSREFKNERVFQYELDDIKEVTVRQLCLQSLNKYTESDIKKMSEKYKHILSHTITKIVDLFMLLAYEEQDRNLQTIPETGDDSLQYYDS